MIGKSTFLLICLLILCGGCFKNKNLKERLDTLEKNDYSGFKNMKIVNRKGIYYITYNESDFECSMSYFTKKVTANKITSNNNSHFELKDKDIYQIEHALKVFNSMNIQALSVDSIGNVLLSIPWYENSTYYFLKLSKFSSLKDINKSYYDKYDGDWYIYKERSE